MIELNWRRFDFNDALKIKEGITNDINSILNNIIREYGKYRHVYHNKEIEEMNIRRYISFDDDLHDVTDKEYFRWLDGVYINIIDNGEGYFFEPNISITKDDEELHLYDLSLNELISLRYTINGYFRPFYVKLSESNDDSDKKYEYLSIDSVVPRITYIDISRSNWLLVENPEDIPDIIIEDVYETLSDSHNWVYDGQNLYLRRSSLVWFSGTTLLEIDKWVDKHYTGGADALIDKMGDIKDTVVGKDDK